MSTFIIQVTCNSDTTDSEMQKLKDEITAHGGRIVHEYTIIKGFSFTRPEASTLDLNTLSSHPNVDSVEADQVVTTQ
ncbi:uncharacterized protein N7484_006351 [Penicillium longicatenatum]|uniref:uncharacterized protein n=1 Tax=Penicillium longicatenatum TaxID=1561947 RepID=UPI002549150F|nr:uncharacterized protein N7484_006351 [Penicillium longicatenatum]KAJ5643844.1 hypothetical protein N7484_006351 [Penicillium longicatenatum]